MVTASHNPPRDNGYKVYWSDGAQIVPPIDDAISAAIDGIGPLALSPIGGPGEPVETDIVDNYLGAIIAALPPSASHDISTVYTPPYAVSVAACYWPVSSGPGSPLPMSWSAKATLIPTSSRCPNRTPKNPVLGLVTFSAPATPGY